MEITKTPIENRVLVFNLDDFCEAYMTKDKWELLFELKKIAPNIKITMFTIPLKCSSRWLAYVKENFGDWIQMALHGTTHSEHDSFFTENDANVAMHFYNDKFFSKCFKAPKWHLGKDAYDKFRNDGFIVATNKTNSFAANDDECNYRYDRGQEIIKDMLYRAGNLFSLHGHITVSVNGISEVFSLFCQIVVQFKNFKFIDEVSVDDYKEDMADESIRAVA